MKDRSAPSGAREASPSHPANPPTCYLSVRVACDIDDGGIADGKLVELLNRHHGNNAREILSSSATSNAAPYPREWIRYRARGSRSAHRLRQLGHLFCGGRSFGWALERGEHLRARLPDGGILRSQLRRGKRFAIGPGERVRIQ